MQIFVAILSNPIDQDEFEKSWRLGCEGNLLRGANVVMAGRKVSLMLEPGPDGRWQTEVAHRTISGIVRRVDQNCNIRWI